MPGLAYAIAIGPSLQNPEYTYDDKDGINVEDMIYGTCVDVTIEFAGKTYYIPAVIVDVKAHTSPNGCIQTNVLIVDKDHDGKQDESELDVDESGNIVEWYTEQCDGEKNKSEGSIQFDRCAGIIIYRDERALVKNEME